MDGLKFVIKRQWITRIDNFKPVAKSKNYLYAKFVFSSDEWTGIKTALFASSNTERPVPMLLDENGVCRVPHEVLDWDAEGDFTVSVFCGDLITANKASVHVYETGYTDDAGQEEPPTPSIYAQILARLNGVENLEVYAETLPEGSEASVEKSVDPETDGYVFNFGIPKGDKGDTGFAPVVTVGDITGGHRITIEDATHTYTFNVMDGVNGEDGYSPTIVVGDITGGHRVIITDKNGEHIFNVMDGQDYVLTQADKEEIAAMVDLSDYAKKTDLDGKVDKVTGKGLSTNDYTTEEKNKLSGIEAGAKANVQSDWDQTDTSADNYIKNKPEIPSAVTVDDELSDASENPVQNKVIVKALKDKADIIITSASGTVASFSDGGEYDAVGLVADFAPYQEGSGDPSPSNVHPIHGWTGLDIFDRNRNLLQVTAESKTQAGVEWIVNSDGTIDVSGTATGYSTLSIGQAVIEGIKDKTVCISGLSEVTNVVWDTFVLYDKNGSQIASLTISSASDKTIDLSQYSGVHHITINAKRASNIATSGTIRPKVEFGSTATPYEPYNGTTTPISWQTEAGEVFGGYVDVVRGKGVKTWGLVDLSTLTWSTTSNRVRTDSLSNVISIPSSGTVLPDIVCEKYGKIYFNASLDNYPNHIAILGNGSLIMKYTSGDPLPSGNMAYKLATPIEYDITPATIELLKGYNNVWSSAGGNVDVDYRADTKLYLESHATKVDDVQVNGTSIVNQGVANVPLADAYTAGVLQIGADYGITKGSGAWAYLSKATDAQLKAGEQIYKPVVSSNAYLAAFYGLAKAAGSDEKNSSLPAGQYTDAAKIAIQKMLGVYEPPYELLNDITLESESEIYLTADSNGTPYNLLGVYIYVYYAAGLTTASTGYARYRVYDSNGSYCNAETGKYSTNANAKFKHLLLDRKNNLAFLNYTNQQTVGGSGAWNIKSVQSAGMVNGLGNIVKIALASGDVEPAGTRIQIYGQRAY